MDTQTPDLEAVVERLGRVEKQNRRLKVAGIAALVLIGALMLLAAAPPKPGTIKAERFVLVDKHGRNRAVLAPDQRLLGQEDQSFLGLTLFDEGGKMRVALVAREKDPANKDAGLILLDAEARPQVALGAQTDSAELTFYNSKGETPVCLTGSSGGSLTLADRNGKYRISLVAGLPSILRFDDDENKTRIKLGFPVEGRDDFMPRLRFYDKDHKVVWQAPPLDDAPEKARAGEE